MASKVWSKIALVDADGPLLDFTSRLMEELGEGCPTREKFHSHRLKDVLSVEQWAIAKSRMSVADFWFDIPPVLEAEEAVESLRDMGLHVVVATAPWTGCKEWESARREVLECHFDIKAEDVIICNSHRKCLLGGVDYFIDDKMDTIEEWIKSGNKGKCYLFAEPWNATSVLRRWTWGEILWDINKDGF